MHLFSNRGSFLKFPATQWYFPTEEQRDEGCLPTALISFGSFAEGEEERAAEAASRSINEKEVALPAIRVPHTRPPGGHRRGPTRGSGTRALLPLQPRQGRLMPYRERNAGSHGAGASAQKNRLLGFEFLHPFSCQAAPLVHGSYSARAQAFASGKVSWVSPGITWSMQGYRAADAGHNKGCYRTVHTLQCSLKAAWNLAGMITVTLWHI